MIDPAFQATLEQWLGLTFFAALAVVLIGEWSIMTFMWPRTQPEWAVWAKTTAFLTIVIARLVRYITGVERFPFPVGAIINAAALVLILYFGKVYLWDTWVRGRYDRTGGADSDQDNDHARDFVVRYWGVRRDRKGPADDRAD